MARNFNASNNQRLTNGFSFSGYPISISAMFRDTSGTNNDRCIVQIQDSTQSDRYFRLGRNSSTAGLYCASRWDLGGDNGAITTSTITTNQWHHAFMTATSANRRDVWLDNAGQGTNTGGWGSPVRIDSLTIGYEDDSSPGDPWDGDLAEVAVWDVELTAEERALLAGGCSPTWVRAESLVFYSPMIRGASGGNDFDVVGGRILTTAGTGTPGVASHPRIQPRSAQILQFRENASSGLTVNDSSESLTLTENSETISLSLDVQDASESLTLTENSETIGLTVDVQDASESLEITEYPETIGLSLNVVDSSEALTLTEFDETVTTSSGQVNDTSEALVLTENQETITLDLTVNDSSEGLTLT